MTATDIISVDQAKAFLRVDFDDDNDIIQGLIISAIDLVEQKTQQRLYQRTEVYNSDGTYNVDIFFTPINGIVITNLDGIVQTKFPVKVEPVRRTVEFVKERIGLYGIPNDFNNGFGPPFGNMLAASLPLYNINIDCGYTQYDQIPYPLMQAVKTIISYMYENRDMSKVDLPSNIMLELESYNRNPLF